MPADPRSGTVADYPKCVVVSLHLSNNSLSGAISPSLGIALDPSRNYSTVAQGAPNGGPSARMLQELELEAWERTFHDLQELHIDENQLHGRLPYWLLFLERLRSLRLQGNRFEYETPVFGKSSLDELYLRCDSGDIVSCTGIPTGSCSAFFPPAAVRRNHRHACTVCEQHRSIPIAPFLAVPAAPWLGQFVASAALLCLFCRFIIGDHRRARSLNERPRQLRRWVAGVSILITHCQTMALVGDLRLALPDEVRVVSAFLSVDYTWLTAPECTRQSIGPGTDRQAFFFVQLVHGLMISALLMGLLWRRAYVAKRKVAACVALQDPHLRFTTRPSKAHTRLRRWAETRLDDRLDLVRSTVHSITFGISLRTCLQLLTVVRDELDWEAVMSTQLSGHVAQVSAMLLKYFTAMLLVQANVLSWREDRQALADRDEVLGDTADRLEWSSYIRQRFVPCPPKRHASSWQQVIFVQQLAIALCSLLVDIFGRATVPVVAHALTVLATLLSTWWLQALMQPYEYSFMNLAASGLALSNLLLVSISLLHEVMLRASDDPAQLPGLWTVQRLFLAPGLLTLSMAVYLIWGLVTSVPPSKRDRTPSARPRRCNDGTYVPIAVELSPLHGRAVEYLQLPDNALAVENVAEAQSEAAAMLSGGVRFPDALAVYGALRPQGDPIERSLFLTTFDAFIAECSTMDDDEQLRLIARIRAATGARVWRCRLSFCGVTADGDGAAEPGTLSAYEWHCRWTRTEEWQLLLACAQDRKVTKRAALLTLPATADRPSTLDALFVFHASKTGGQLCREVVEGPWLPYHGSMRPLWTQLRQEWDVLCESGVSSWPRFGETGAGREDFTPLQLDRLDYLDRYMDALLSSPVPALWQRMQETCHDHEIRVASKGTPSTAMQQIRSWLAAPVEIGAGLITTGRRAQSMIRALEQEVHAAMLAATANVHPSLDASMQKAWPDEASALEPTDSPLERRMQRILQSVRKYSHRGYVDEIARQPSFMQLGFSVHLCRHMASRSSDACVLEKWWITFVDRRVQSPSRELVLNEWLGNDLRHVGRMGSALNQVNPSDAAIQEVYAQARRGAAVVYDSAFASAVCLPRDTGGTLAAAALMLSRTPGEPSTTTRDGEVRFAHEEEAREVEASTLFAEELARLAQRLVLAKQRSSAPLAPQAAPLSPAEREALAGTSPPLTPEETDTPSSPTPTPPPSPPERQQSSSAEATGTGGAPTPSADARDLITRELEAFTQADEGADRAASMGSDSTATATACHHCGAHVQGGDRFCGACGGALTLPGPRLPAGYGEGQEGAVVPTAASESLPNAESPAIAAPATENADAIAAPAAESADAIAVPAAESAGSMASVPESSIEQKSAALNPQQSETSGEARSGEADAPGQVEAPSQAEIAASVEAPILAEPGAPHQPPDTFEAATPALAPAAVVATGSTPVEVHSQYDSPAETPRSAGFQTLTEAAEPLISDDAAAAAIARAEAEAEAEAAAAARRAAEEQRQREEAVAAAAARAEHRRRDSEHEHQQRQRSQACFMKLAGDSERLPLARLGAALLMLERDVTGARLQELVARVQWTSDSALTADEFHTLLTLDEDLRRQTLFLRLLATCPSGVLEVLGIPPLWQRAPDGLSAARQDWYAQLCHAVVWGCLSIQRGELQLREWAHLQAVAAEASLSWPTSTADEIAMRVHACANDSLSHRSEDGVPHRECCCWLTFEKAAQPLTIAGELHVAYNDASVVQEERERLAAIETAAVEPASAMSPAIELSAVQLSIGSQAGQAACTAPSSAAAALSCNVCGSPVFATQTFCGLCGSAAVSSGGSEPVFALNYTESRPDGWSDNSMPFAKASPESAEPSAAIAPEASPSASSSTPAADAPGAGAAWLATLATAPSADSLASEAAVAEAPSARTAEPDALALAPSATADARGDGSSCEATPEGEPGAPAPPSEVKSASIPPPYVPATLSPSLPPSEGDAAPAATDEQARTSKPIDENDDGTELIATSNPAATLAPATVEAHTGTMSLVSQTLQSAQSSLQAAMYGAGRDD